MKKIMIVFGTGSEAIKLCPLINLLQSKGGNETKVCIVGHQLNRVTQVMDIFEIKPDYDFSTSQLDLNIYDYTISVLEKIKSVLENEKPDLVLVQGDTTTAFATSLASYYLNIPIGHIEAGIRSYNMRSPFPEEFNRQAVGILASYHFVPTRRARLNLLNEGKDPESIFVTGNTAVDALKRTIQPDYTHPLLKWADGSQLILMVLTHIKNEEDLRHIYRAMEQIVKDVPGTKLICPFSSHDNTHKLAEEMLGNNEHIRLLPSLLVVDFHNFLFQSAIVLTDSHGVQEEATSLGKPVLVLRDEPLYPEELKTGVMKMVGTDGENILRQCKWILTDQSKYNEMSKGTSVYGDGYASNRIADIIHTGRRWEWTEQTNHRRGFTDKGLSKKKRKI